MCVSLYAHVHMCVLDSEEPLDKEGSSRGALSARDVPGTLPWPCRHRCIHRSGSHNSREAGIIMTLILQMRSLMFQKGKQLVQGHTASNWQSQDSDSGFSHSRAGALPNVTLS